MNKFFTSVATSLVSKLPTCSGIFNANSDKVKRFYCDKGVTPGKFGLEPVSEHHIQKLLERLNPGKGAGLDSIPSRFLVDGSDILKVPLTHIINTSIITGVFPRGV